MLFVIMSPKIADGVSIIILNYRSVDVLHRCLADLAHIIDGTNTEIIVVNNDEAPLTLTTNLPVRIIEVNRNIGFGAANNRGLAAATKPYTFFLNPDTYAFSPQILSLTTTCADGATIAAPAVHNTDGSMQAWSCGNAVTLFSIIANNFHLHQKPWLERTQQPVNWISGVAICGPTAFLRRLGGFDEDFFLYFEDVDLCERVRRAGGRVVRDPAHALTHSSGSSTADNRAFQKTCYYTSQDLFIRKHRGPLQAAILRALRVFHPHS